MAKVDLNAKAKFEPNPGYEWFAVMSRPTLEFVAQHHLRLLGYRTFLPYEEVRRRRKIPNRDQMRIDWVPTALFPRYLFVRNPIGQGLMDVNDCEGVATVVYCGDAPLPIPDEIMAELKSRADITGLVGKKDTTARERLMPGAQVRFVDGNPLAGLLAVVNVDRNQKIRVWCEALRREVTTSAEQIEVA